MPSWSSGFWRRRYECEDREGRRRARGAGTRRRGAAAAAPAAFRRAGARPTRACSNRLASSPARRAGSSAGRWRPWSWPASSRRSSPSACRKLAGLADRRGHRPDGFTLRHVEDARQCTASRPRRIYDIAFNQDSPAMPLVDLDRTRERLLRSALDPRGAGVAPAARHARHRGDRARAGRGLATAAGAASGRRRGRRARARSGSRRSRSRPRLIGPDANRRYAALSSPARRRARGCARRSPTPIGSASAAGTCTSRAARCSALPEGEAEARRAIERFAQLDQRDSLLGRGFARIDMRDPAAPTSASRASPARASRATPAARRPGPDRRTIWRRTI